MKEANKCVIICSVDNMVREF